MDNVLVSAEFPEFGPAEGFVDDGGEGEVGRHEESKKQGHDGEAGVGRTEGEEKDGEGGEYYCRVGHHQGVHPGEVRDPAGDDPPQSVGDPDDGDEEGGVLHADVILEESKWRL